MPEGVFAPLQTRDASSPTVRIALSSDADALFDLVQDLYRDNGEGITLPKSDEKSRKHVEACCNRQGGLAGVIDGADGRLRASIGIFATTPWYSDSWDLLSALWIYERPEYRRGRATFDALLDFAEWHRQDMERRLGRSLEVELTVNSIYRLAARERLWASRGRKIGGVFLLNRTGT